VELGRTSSGTCDSIISTQCPGSTATSSCDSSGFVTEITIVGQALQAPSILHGDSFEGLLRLSSFACRDCTALSGTIPASLFRPSLLDVTLTGTSLSGTLPTTVFVSSNLPTLHTLEITGNSQLSGTLAASLFTLPSLTTVQLHRNALSGTIPSSIANPAAGDGMAADGKGLLTLSLYGNRFTGALPLVGMAADAAECRIVATPGDSTASVTNLLLCPQQYTSFTGGMGLNALCSRVGYAVDKLCTDEFRARAGGNTAPTPRPPNAPSPAVVMPTPLPTQPPSGGTVNDGTALPPSETDVGLIVGIVAAGVCLLCSMLVGVCVCLGLTRHTWASSSRSWSSRRH